MYYKTGSLRDELCRISEVCRSQQKNHVLHLELQQKKRGLIISLCVLTFKDYTKYYTVYVFLGDIFTCFDKQLGHYIWFCNDFIGTKQKQILTANLKYQHRS